MSTLELLGRKRPLFTEDLKRYGDAMQCLAKEGRFLVIGGAGSIGRTVVHEIFKRNPRLLHVIDINENNLVELVRDLRSSIGYIAGEFRTFSVDVGSVECDALLAVQKGYDYVLNLSALKHVRSERDPFTLMRLVQVNIINSDRMRARAAMMGARKYFCVSTDKATNPVNMMGCSKRIMELFLFSRSDAVDVSTARFANVAFSDGSLLHGFEQRIAKRQPLSAPRDVRRYFITQEEAGVLCLFSCLLGLNRETYFPRLDENAELVSFTEIAVRFLAQRGFRAVECESEEEARACVEQRSLRSEWPVYFFESDTTGEKPYEEFYLRDSDLDWERFVDLGVVRNRKPDLKLELERFEKAIEGMRNRLRWEKVEIVNEFRRLVPEFDHVETGKYLDDRM